MRVAQDMDLVAAWGFSLWYSVLFAFASTFLVVVSEVVPVLASVGEHVCACLLYH